MNDDFVVIKKAGVSDLNNILEFAVKLVHQHQKFNPLRFVEFTNHNQQLRDFFATQLSNSRAVILVAEYQDKMVAYAFLQQEEANFIDICAETVWLHDIYVDESARGLGVGERLLQSAIQTAKALGSRTLMLHVAAQNPRARDFFAAHGFEVSVYEMIKNLDAE